MPSSRFETTRPEISFSTFQIAFFFAFVLSLNLSKVIFFAKAFSYIYVFFSLTETKVKLIAMEPKAAELLAVLKNPNLSIDSKVAHLTGLKSDIKQKNVPEGAVPSVFECLRVSITSPHQPLIAAGFSTLGHFLKRLFIQEQDALIAQQSRALCPVLLERLGDHKERLRAQAAQAFTDLWPAAGPEVEYHVLESALVGKNPKAKEMSMIWLSSMTKSHGLLFRQYVPSLVSCLEDADSTIRDTAKMTVVELFRNAPARAKADLQRQLVAHNVRPSIANPILMSIGLGNDVDLHHTSISRPEAGPPRPPSRGDALMRAAPSRPPSRGDALIQRSMPARPPSRGDALVQRSIPIRPPSRGDALHQKPIAGVESQPARPPSRGDALHQPTVSASTRSQVDAVNTIGGSHLASQNNSASMRSTGRSNHEQKREMDGFLDFSEQPLSTQNSRPRSQDGDHVEPLIVSSSREVDDILRDMTPFFEGRESEENWMNREKSVVRLRRLTCGNAPHTYPQNYLALIKALLDGIFKVVNSLRTTLSTTGLLMVQDLARICGPKIDPMLEIIMQNLVKLCGGQKKITAKNGNQTVEIVIQHVTYTSRLLHHVSSASQDKSNQTRQFSAGWLRTLINRQAHNKESVEHGGGLDTLATCIEKGLRDPTPDVRETMRSTFWTFHRVWSKKADEIMSKLDDKQRSMLNKDPSNPNGEPSKNPRSSKKGVPSSTPAASGSSALKKAIAAQKKARLSPAKPLLPRRGSVDSVLPGTASSTSLSSKSSTTRTGPTGSQGSSLSSAPVRPAAKPRRPEAARPATADPYASRRAAGADLRSKTPSTFDGSPRNPRTKPSTPVKPTSPKKTKPKKLDFSTIRTKEPNSSMKHRRNQSHESAGCPSPGISRVSAPGTSYGFESPASVQLESPPPYGIQLVDTSDGVNVSSGANIFSSDSEPKPMGRQVMTGSSPNENSELETLEVPGLTSGLTTRLHDPVHIYEDPVSPVTDRQCHSNIASTIPTELHSYGTQHEAAEKHHGQFLPLGTPSKEGELQLGFDASVQQRAGLEQDVGSSSVIIEPSSGLPDPEPHSGPATPVTVRRISPGAADNTKPYDSSRLGSPEPRADNNENTTHITNMRKIALSFAGRSSSKQHVLGELPSHEPSHRDNTPVLHVEHTRPRSSGSISTDESTTSVSKKPDHFKRRSISPRSKDIRKAREMLEKGIQRIRTRSLDILGFRKLQDLIEYHESIFVNQAKYDEMLVALLDELQSPHEDGKRHLGRPLDLKTQVLLTVRYMLSRNNKYFASYHARAITAMIGARKHYSSGSHALSGMEDTMNDILDECDLAEVINATIDAVSAEEENDEGNRAVEMGIAVLSKVLCRVKERKAGLPEHLMERIGSFAAEKFTNRHPDVRRQVTQLCVSLRSMATTDDRFWQVLGWPQESTRNLLVYYIAKNT